MEFFTLPSKSKQLPILRHSPFLLLYPVGHCADIVHVFVVELYVPSSHIAHWGFQPLLIYVYPLLHIYAHLLFQALFLSSYSLLSTFWVRFLSLQATNVAFLKLQKHTFQFAQYPLCKVKNFTPHFTPSPAQSDDLVHLHIPEVAVWLQWIQIHSLSSP